MRWRDKNGHFLQYGDYIEDLEKRYIGQIVRSHINDKPVLHIIKQLNYSRMEYVNVGNASAPVCYERTFLPDWSRLRKWYYGYRLPYIELIQHGERNRRKKEF